MKQRLQVWGDSKIIKIVGAFVFNEDGEVLLLQRHTDDLGGGQWGTLCGKSPISCYNSSDAVTENRWRRENRDGRVMATPYLQIL